MGTSTAEEISLSWNAPTGEAASYLLERSANGIGGWTQIGGTITDTTYEDSSLDPGKTYYYRVFAVNSAGDLSVTAATGNFTTDTQPLDTPTLVNSSTDSVSIIVSWDTVLHATHYIVKWGTVNDITLTTGEEKTDDNHFILHGLYPYAEQSFYFWVIAHNENEDSGYNNSTPLAVGQLTSPKSDKPETQLANPIIKSAMVDGTEVIITWDFVMDGNDYLVEYRKIGDVDWIEHFNYTGTIEMVAVIDVLNPGQYEFKITALGWEDTNTLYKEAVSDVFSSVNVIVQLGTPTLGDLMATGNSISVSWNVMANAHSYRVQYSTDSTFNTGTITVNSFNTSTKITGLNTNTTYYVQVMAVGTNNYGDSGYSAMKSITTEQEPDPPTPGVVNVNTQIDKKLATVKGVKLDKKDSKPTLTSLAFTWTPASTFSADEVTFDVWVPKTKTVPAKLVATATVTWERLTGLDVNGTPLTIPSGDCIITITAKNSKGKDYLEIMVSGLDAGTKHTVEMQAKNGDGTTPYSKVTKISASTAKYTAVKSLKRTSIGLQSVVLTWKEPVKVPGNPTTGYTIKVYLATDKKLENPIETLTQFVTDSTATIEGLAENTKYVFVVQAVAGELGVSSMIARVGATTLNPAKYPAVGGFKARTVFFYAGFIEIYTKKRQSCSWGSVSILKRRFEN